jgi:hypothetical protein
VVGFSHLLYLETYGARLLSHDAAPLKAEAISLLELSQVPSLLEVRGCTVLSDVAVDR